MTTEPEQDREQCQEPGGEFWSVHVHGPDDVIPFDSEDEAQAYAAALVDATKPGGLLARTSEFDPELSAHVIPPAASGRVVAPHVEPDWLTTDCIRCDDERVAKLPWPQSLSRRMIVCPECGNKRCPKATWHGNNCTGSNEPGQPGSDYGATLSSMVDPFAASAGREGIDTQPEPEPLLCIVCEGTATRDSDFGHSVCDCGSCYILADTWSAHADVHAEQRTGIEADHV